MTYANFSSYSEALVWLEEQQDHGFNGYIITLNSGTHEVRIW